MDDLAIDLLPYPVYISNLVDIMLIYHGQVEISIPLVT